MVDCEIFPWVEQPAVGIAAAAVMDEEASVYEGALEFCYVYMNESTMNTDKDRGEVCDVQLAPKYDHHPEGLLINNKLWRSVTEFVDAGGDFYVGMLAKLAQNLHLQPLLGMQLQFQQHLPPSRQTQCFQWLHSEFCPRSAQDIFELVHCLAACNAHVQSSVIGLFQRSQPYVGATQSVLLSSMYIQKLVYGHLYPEDIEQQFKAFELNNMNNNNNHPAAAIQQ